MQERELHTTTTYQLPILEIAQQRVELLQAEAEEKRALERRLSEIEESANELRVQLGRKATEKTFFFLPTPEQESRREAEESENKSKAMEIVEGLALPDDTPITFKRREHVDLDMAGAYDIDTKTHAQSGGGLLFIEENIVSTDHRDENGPRTNQYLIGSGLERPLKVTGSSSKILPGAFLLNSAELYGWRDAGYKVAALRRELVTEKLKETTLELLEGQPLQEGRWPGEPVQVKVIDLGGVTSFEVRAGYYDRDESKSPVLQCVGLYEIVNGEVQRRASLDVLDGSFDMYIKGNYLTGQARDPQIDYRNMLDLVEALLVGREK